jgi:hypothetical protein
MNDLDMHTVGEKDRPPAVAAPGGQRSVTNKHRHPFLYGGKPPNPPGLAALE